MLERGRIPEQTRTRQQGREATSQPKRVRSTNQKARQAVARSIIEALHAQPEPAEFEFSSDSVMDDESPSAGGDFSYDAEEGDEVIDPDGEERQRRDPWDRFERRRRGRRPVSLPYPSMLIRRNTSGDKLHAWPLIHTAQNVANGLKVNEVLEAVGAWLVEKKAPFLSVPTLDEALSTLEPRMTAGEIAQELRDQRLTPLLEKREGEVSPEEANALGIDASTLMKAWCDITQGRKKQYTAAELYKKLEERGSVPKETNEQARTARIETLRKLCKKHKIPVDEGAFVARLLSEFWRKILDAPSFGPVYPGLLRAPDRRLGTSGKDKAFLAEVLRRISEDGGPYTASEMWVRVVEEHPDVSGSFKNTASGVTRVRQICQDYGIPSTPDKRGRPAGGRKT